MPPEYVRTSRPPASREVELLEQLVRALARSRRPQVVEPPDHLEVLEAGQVLVDGGVLAASPIARTRGRSRDDVDAGDPRRPPSGFSSVVRIRTAVVLPAPFGPSSPRTDPVATPRSTPSSATTFPNRFEAPSSRSANSRSPAISHV